MAQKCDIMPRHLRKFYYNYIGKHLEIDNDRKGFEKKYLQYCRLVGRFLKSSSSEELKQAVNFLRWNIEPDIIIGAARFSLIAGLLFFTIVIAFSIVFGFSFIYLIFLLFLPILMFYGITEWPKMYMKDRAVENLGFSPQIISQISVSLGVKPNLESSLAVATRYGNNDIVVRMRHILWDIWAGKIKNLNAAMGKLAEEWGRFSRGFQRSIYLILGSFDESDMKKKQESLDKSINSILDDISERMSDYANSLHTPTLILFSLGIIVPLMIISVFPIVSFFGLKIGIWAVTSFLFVSLLASFLYSSFILRKRPITFSLKDVKSDIPDGYIKIGSVLIHSVSLSLIVLFILSVPTFFYIALISGTIVSGPFKILAETLNTYPLLWGICISLTIYFYSKSVYKKELRDKIRELEEEFVDSLYHLGNRLSDGKPIESAMEYVSKIMKHTSMGKFYKHVLNKIKRRNMSLDKAIEEENIDSDMIKSSLNMIIFSLRNGGLAAAKTTKTISDYMGRIKNVNKSLNNMLDKHLVMMKTTSMFFAPIVCAVIVVLFQMITATISKGGTSGPDFTGMSQVNFVKPSIDPPILQLIVGVYLLGLNYILMRYVTRIQYGSDRVMLYYNLSRSFPTSLLVFTLSMLISENILLKAWLGM